MNLCDSIRMIGSKKFFTTHRYRAHIVFKCNQPFAKVWKEIPFYIYSLLRYMLLFFWGLLGREKKIGRKHRNTQLCERVQSESERDDGISGAEQSYQPFVGINHPIQPGDWHSTAPCSGYVWTKCFIRLIRLVFGRWCQKSPFFYYYVLNGHVVYLPIHELSEQKNGCLEYKGDEMLPSYVGIITNYHYKDKPDPRHPNTSWAGIWTPNTYPKHLLRRCLDVYGNTIFLILNTFKLKVVREKNISQILHCFWFSQSFASQQKTRPTEPISVTRKHKNHTESLGGSFKYFLSSPRTLGKMNPFWRIFSWVGLKTTNQINTNVWYIITYIYHKKKQLNVGINIYYMDPMGT